MGTSPQDSRTLAPVDVQSHAGWLKLFFNVFQQKNINTVGEARGVAPLALLTVGYVEKYNQQTGPSAAKLRGGSRGYMSDVPTPQALIRQVTGIGDPAKGR